MEIGRFVTVPSRRMKINHPDKTIERCAARDGGMPMVGIGIIFCATGDVMHAEDFRQFVSELATLDAQQKNEVAIRLKHLGASGGTEKPAATIKDDPADDWLARGIALSANARGLLIKPDPRAIRHAKAGAFTVFKKKAPDARQLLLNGFASIPPRQAKESIARLASDAMFEYGRSFMQAPSLSTLLYNIDRVGEVMERAYPGYHVNKLYGLLTTGIA